LEEIQCWRGSSLSPAMRRIFINFFENYSYLTNFTQGNKKRRLTASIYERMYVYERKLMKKEWQKAKALKKIYSPSCSFMHKIAAAVFTFIELLSFKMVQIITLVVTDDSMPANSWYPRANQS
jgi:hypothetical protein